MPRELQTLVVVVVWWWSPRTHVQPILGVCSKTLYFSGKCWRAVVPGGAADMYSLGVLCYYVLCGEEPFDFEYDESGVFIMTYFEAYERLQVGNPGFDKEAWRAADVDGDATCLVRSLMHSEPWMRPTAEQMLQHAWFAPAVLATGTITARRYRRAARDDAVTLPGKLNRDERSCRRGLKAPRKPPTKLSQTYRCPK